MPGTFEKTINKWKLLLNIAPIILHAPHEEHGFDLSQKNYEENNIKLFEEVKQFSNELNAEKIIIHCGTGTVDQAIECLEKLNFKDKILLENLPIKGINGEHCIGTNYKEMKMMLREGYGFCMDFSHVYKTAFTIHKQPKKLINQMRLLKPWMFHLCNGTTSEIDEHLNLYDKTGCFNLKLLKAYIESSGHKRVTLETPKWEHSLENDVRNLEFLKSEGCRNVEDGKW